jgi:hypothetical protein
MPPLTLRGHNWREEIVKYSYPFDERSELEDDGVYIGTDLFIDACIYLKESAELPLYLARLDGTIAAATVRVYIKDSAGDDVAYIDIVEDVEELPIYSIRGVRVGIGVMYAPGVTRFINAYRGKVIDMLSSTAAFVLNVTHVSRTKYLRGVVAGNNFLTGDVVLEARNGCEFEVVGDQIQLHILGVPASESVGDVIKSINGVARPDIWLENHPRLNLRIATDSSGLHFIAAEDAK